MQDQHGADISGNATHAGVNILLHLLYNTIRYEDNGTDRHYTQQTDMPPLTDCILFMTMMTMTLTNNLFFRHICPYNIKDIRYIQCKKIVIVHQEKQYAFYNHDLRSIF